MQEDIERRTIAISVTATKLTAQTMAKAFQAVLQKIQTEHIKRVEHPQGRQSVKRLTHHYDAKTMPLNGSTRLFDQIVKEKHLNVDYAFIKTAPKKYVLFFKAAQVDAITTAFSEYTKRVMRRGRRSSVRAQMRQATDIIRKIPLERERGRERARSDR